MPLKYLHLYNTILTSDLVEIRQFGWKTCLDPVARA